MTQAVKRACDACHRRKVKCDGLNPCRNCNASQLSCTYNAIPQKKGPKGSRAKVISELRETQRQTTLLARLHCKVNNCIPAASLPAGVNPAPGYIHADLVKQSINFFFTKMYTMMPILEHNEVTRMFNDMDKDAEAYSLIAALCAFVLYQPGMQLPGLDSYMLQNVPSANLATSELLIDEAIRVRRGYDYLHEPSLATMVTSYFLSCCSKFLDIKKRSWFYLRETSTMFLMTNMHKEETYRKWLPSEAYRRRCLYWQVFATEKLLALQEYYPVSLQPTISSPNIYDENGNDLTFFSHIISLSHPLEDTIISLLKKLRQSIDPQQIEMLRQDLHDLVMSIEATDATQSNFAEYNSINSWLNNLSWEYQNIQSGEQNVSFSGIMAQILNALPNEFPNQGMEIMGNAVLDSMINLSIAALPALSARPIPRNPTLANPHKLLQNLLEALAALRSCRTHFIPLILFQLVDVLALLCEPMLNDVPDIMASIDLFDGFGSAGIPQNSMFDTPKFSIGESSVPPPPPPTQQNQPQQMPPVPQQMTSPFSTASPTSISSNSIPSNSLELSQSSLQDFNIPDLLSLQQPPRSNVPQQQMRLTGLLIPQNTPSTSTSAQSLPIPQQLLPTAAPQPVPTAPPQSSPPPNAQIFKGEPGHPVRSQFPPVYMGQRAGNVGGYGMQSPSGVVHGMAEFHLQQGGQRRDGLGFSLM